MSTLLLKRLGEKVQEAGFPLWGAVDLELALPLYKESFKNYRSWIQKGFQGEMAYLVRGLDRKSDPKKVFPGVQSILAVALPYPARPRNSCGPLVARYIQGRDYHEVLKEKLEEGLRGLGQDLQWKVCVDTSAVLERSWAAICGLGWIGKNGMLIHPQLGSYLYVGVALLSEKVGRGPQPMRELCGNCESCLKGCPTEAFQAPKILDANRCISYWTLEKRGDLNISRQDERRMGRWVAGCDVCQEVCPFNQKSSNRDQDVTADNLDWSGHLYESEQVYRRRVKHSAANRIKPSEFRRNLAIAFANELESINIPNAE